MEPWWLEEEPTDYSLHIKVLFVICKLLTEALLQYIKIQTHTAEVVSATL